MELTCGPPPPPRSFSEWLRDLGVRNPDAQLDPDAKLSSLWLSNQPVSTLSIGHCACPAHRIVRCAIQRASSRCCAAHTSNAPSSTSQRECPAKLRTQARQAAKAREPGSQGGRRLACSEAGGSTLSDLGARAQGVRRVHQRVAPHVGQASICPGRSKPDAAGVDAVRRPAQPFQGLQGPA